MYEQYVVILQQKYPELVVHGENYPPPPYRAKFAQFLVYEYITDIHLICLCLNHLPIN